MNHKLVQAVRTGDPVDGDRPIAADTEADAVNTYGETAFVVERLDAASATRAKHLGRANLTVIAQSRHIDI